MISLFPIAGASASIDDDDYLFPLEKESCPERGMLESLLSIQRYNHNYMAKVPFSAFCLLAIVELYFFACCVG